MFSNKKGLSTVVTTLIIILLVLVAIGIVWVVIRGVIESGAGQIAVSSKCPMLDLRVTYVNTTAGSSLWNSCNRTQCQIELYRASGGEEEGVFYKIAATNGTSTCFYTATTEIKPLDTIKPTVTFDGGCTLGGMTAVEVSVTPFLFDTSNEAKLCPNSNKYTVV